MSLSAKQVSEAGATESARGRLDAVHGGWREHLGWIAGLFLTGLGAKLWLIHRCGSPLPFLDQWDAEAANLYLPWFEGRLTWADLFRAHNEHCIFTTRIYCLLLLWLNGQWDNQMQAVANACIHSAGLAGFGGLLARRLGKRFWPWIWPPLALALVLPFAWENTLGGFQVQFYFLLIFSLLCLWCLALEKPWSARWWLGVASGVGATLSLASGWLAPAAVVGLMVVETGRRRESWRRHWPTLAVCLMFGVAGWLLRVKVPLHHSFQAHSAQAFLAALGRNLAWPWVVLPWFALFNLLPLILLAWVYLRARSGTDPEAPGEKMILGIGLWVGLQSAAAALVRGGLGGAMPSWRYMDLLSFVMIIGWLSMAILLVRHDEDLPLARYAKLALVLWGASCLLGLGLLTNRVWTMDIPERMEAQQKWLANTRTFLATDDPRVLQDKLATDIPYPDADRLVELLRNPHIRSILPVEVSIEPRKRGPLTQGADAIMAVAVYIFLAGIALSYSLWRSGQDAPGQAPAAKSGLN